MIPQEAPPRGPIDTLLERLTSFQNLLRSAARRASLFSWFSWGFLYAVVLGLGVAYVLAFLYPPVTFTVNQYGVPTTTVGPLWFYPLPMLPSLVLLAIAVGEVWVGRGEARTGSPRVRPSRREAPSAPGASWTEVVRRSQELATQMRSESEVAFVPLILGGLIVATLIPSLLLTGVLATSSNAIVVVAVIPFALILLLVPFYLVVRSWTRGYQSLLDGQVGSLSRLEQEFFTRFAAVAAGA